VIVAVVVESLVLPSVKAKMKCEPVDFLCCSRKTFSRERVTCPKRVEMWLVTPMRRQVCGAVGSLSLGIFSFILTIVVANLLIVVANLLRR
jgi:hypothetical protein